MKQILTTLRVLIIFGLFALIFPLQLLASESYRANNLIVGTEPGQSIETILEKYNCELIDSIANQQIYLLNTIVDCKAETLATNVDTAFGVAFAEPNFLIGLPESNQLSQSFPDDRRPILQYNISPPDYFNQDNILSINSDEANLISTGDGVVIAVIDNGIASEHPLFDGFIVNNGYDYCDNDAVPAEEPGLAFGHGTFVSGIIKRVAPDCQILPLRAFNGDGSGTIFAVAQAIYYAVEQDVDVINMSFNIYGSESLISRAVKEAARNNIIMVASSGNDNLDISSYPAAYGNVIAVSAIDKSELLADFSNYGRYLDLCAPGVEIYSSLAGEYEWGTWSGTSFSAPMVSATSAMIISKTGKQENAIGQIRDILRSSARTDLLWGTVEPRDLEYGFGCLDALAAMVQTTKGDLDKSGNLNILDINYMVKYLYHDGPAPIPYTEIGDIDNSGVIDYDDLVALVKMIEYPNNNTEHPSGR